MASDSQRARKFNPRPYARGDRPVPPPTIRADSTTPLREGRPIRRPHRPYQPKLTTTPLREGHRRADESRNCATSQHVSIHAPTRGATDMAGAAREFPFTVSIHAPTRGATDRNSFKAICVKEYKFYLREAILSTVKIPPQFILDKNKLTE